MRKRKVYKGRRGQGLLYPTPRKKPAVNFARIIKDDRITSGSYLSNGNLNR